ncbi:MAG TPA: glycosyltransferase family 39 protein [Nitrospirota bacterium]|nr:glycosyltransferase family 39 protein [Nitrospirota bacterium]
MTFSLVIKPHTPERLDQGTRRGDYRTILVLCALCFVVLFFQLGDRPLWDVDEGMHAATSKDMVLTGDWVTTRVNGENFYDKTVLFNWFVSISFLVFGFTEFAARLPAAVLGLATVLVSYAFGRRLFGSRVGLLGGVVLATSPLFIVLSRTVMHDISLAFFISLALYSFYTAYGNQRHRRAHLFLCYAAMGFAVLAKGPIGLLLPGMIIGLFLLVKGRLNFLKEMALGWGALIFLLVAAPWYVLISVRNPDYLSYFFLKQNFGNFLSKTQATHPRPFYYYVPVLLSGMLPWSCFVPLAFLRPLNRRLQKIDDGVLFLLCWFLVIFLFFSLASSKLGTYILPALPAVALLIGEAWHEIMTAPTAGLHRVTAWSLAPLPVLFLLGTAFVMLFQPPLKKMQMQYGISLHDLYGFLIVVTGIVTIALFFHVLRHYRAAFVALAATFVVGVSVINMVYIPLINPYRSTEVLAKEMDGMLPPGENLVFFRMLWDSALFYTNRRATILNSEQELAHYLASNKRVLCVIRREQYLQFERMLKSSYVLGEEGNKLLISNRPMS